jgi:chaperone BCS1
LLYGPPGTGKTSFTQAIAGAKNFNLCYVNLSKEDLNDESFNRMLQDAPTKSILLLEDIDVFKKREGGELYSRDLSFSGFLNALDGVRSQEGQILFMTTNHREKLDPALLRPGRTDV